MLFDNSHIIQTQKIEIEIEDPVVAIGIQNRIADLFYEKLLPKFDLLFNDIFGEKYYASLDNVTIDCGIIENKNWEDDLVETALRKLKSELISTERKEFISFNIEETFFFFLKYGYLPWNSRVESIDEIEKLLVINSKFISKLKEIIAGSASSVDRLVHQFSGNFTEVILNSYVENKDLTDIYSELNKTEYIHLDKRTINKAIFRTFALPAKDNISKRFLNLLNNTLETETKKHELDSKPGNKEYIFISNAGLVILHPFLPEFFERLGLIINHQWIDEQAQNKGALILEFLVNGIEEFPEFNLPLNKILCGIDIDAVVKEDSPINDEVKRESEELLKEVIKHWTALKNTGIEAFRETFLQRNGKLKKAENGWLLQVEQKGIDIILGKLPWGIGLIKLPWMDKILFVEWA